MGSLTRQDAFANRTNIAAGKRRAIQVAGPSAKAVPGEKIAAVAFVTFLTLGQTGCRLAVWTALAEP